MDRKVVSAEALAHILAGMSGVLIGSKLGLASTWAMLPIAITSPIVFVGFAAISKRTGDTGSIQNDVCEDLASPKGRD